MKTITNVTIAATSLVIGVWCLYGMADDQAAVSPKDVEAGLLDRVAALEADAQADRAKISEQSKLMAELQTQLEGAKEAAKKGDEATLQQAKTEINVLRNTLSDAIRIGDVTIQNAKAASTGLSDSEWLVGVVGMVTHRGDIEEGGPGIFYVQAFSSGGIWHINADFKSDDDHEDWTVIWIAVKRNVLTESKYFPGQIIGDTPGLAR